MSFRPLLVGECPPNNLSKVEKHSPLFPHPTHGSGGRLAALAGVSKDEYFALFDRVNLVPYPHDKWRWSINKARWAAVSLARGGLLRDRHVVLLGARTWDAFFPGVEKEPCTWTILPDSPGALAACLPYPRDTTRWYDDPDNRAMAERFMRGLAEYARERITAQVKSSSCSEC